MPPALRIPGAAIFLLLTSVACADSAPTGDAEAERDQSLSQWLEQEAQSQFDRGDLPAALRAYQRAWRWDQDDRELLDKVVWLSAELGCLDTAVRYAVLRSADQPLGDDALTRRLALHAAQQEDWQAAGVLLGRWLASSGGHASGMVRALALIEHGRAQFLLGDAQAASASFAEVQRMLLDKDNTREARRLGAALGGDLPRLMETFGNCHLEAGHLALAREAFEQLADRSDRRAAAQYWLARLSLAESRALDAYLLLQDYFSEPGDPLEVLPYELLRETLIRLNDEDHLARDLEQISAGREDSPFLALARARLADRQGEPKAARKLYQTV
ncbi:MAG: hypothetical protein KDA37_12080, partial [Planctomycetales bacterium]|nr:hypothetical protein [Planctomycetales bacterium]